MHAQIPPARLASRIAWGASRSGARRTSRCSSWSSGDWVVYDTTGASMRISQCVVPVLTVKRGQVFEPEWGPHPWGWEPKPAA